MALFTDGPPSTIEELAAIDSQLLNVATVEGIDVTQKLALAQNEIGLQLFAQLSGQVPTGRWLWAPPKANLGSIVVTPPLKQWHTYRSLEMVYSDAYNNQLNDRYAGKRDQFHEMAKWASDKLAQIGIGIATGPVPKASAPEVDLAQSASGANLPDATYYVAMSWVNAAGEEGAASDVTAVATDSSTFLVKTGADPEMAAGWNVYAGIDPDNLALQNDQPVPVRVAWLQPGVPVTSGRPPGTGQPASYTRPLPRMILRG
jgi:hypothetical protein